MRSRVAVAALTLATCVAASFSSPPASATAPGGPSTGVPTGSAPAGRSAGEPGPEVTLVTGDVVRLDTTADGTHRAVLVRPTRAASGYHAYTDATGDAHFVPGGADRLLAQGRLDRGLFNVSALVRQKYDDAHTGNLPLIVTYPTTTAATRSAGTFKATVRAPRSLGPVKGVAVAARKSGAKDFWADWSARPDSSAGTLWLDAKVTAVLDQSVPQIGAPAAWQRGFDGRGVTVAVLDTGIDTTHPDFGDRVTATRDFSGKGSVVDGAGHGTHVASILAGSGAASEGRYRGVAPGARLMVGKVLGDDGSGATSQVIEGMQWAATGGADVVNLSLGGPVTRGDDPLSQALNSLSKQYGTVFVVAAGNFSPFMPGSSFVSSPGSAEAALTVGAVNKSDRMYTGSRRGRMGDSAIKPELVAPGVNITAAQAAGTGGDQPYATMTGTSMATPHVAGTAALLLQEHPDWNADRVEAVLTSTTVPLEGVSVVAQGAGRVDVDRATRQGVYVDQGTVDAGYFAQPYDPAKLTVKKTLTYHNDTDTPVTLDLSTNLTDKDGQAAEDPSALTVTPSSLPLAAGGSGEVTVTVDAARVPPSTYTGRVVASDGAKLTVATTVGFYKQDDTVDLTIKAIDRRGNPAQATMRLAPYRQEDFDGRYYPDYIYLQPGETEQVVRVPEGDFNLWAMVLTFDESGRYVEEKSIVSIPRVHAYAPNPTITLDARKAKPVTLSTPQPSTIRSLSLSWWRGTPGGPYNTYDSMGVMVSDGSEERVSVAGTDKVTDAPFVVTTAFDAGPPVLTGQIVGGATLHPVWEGGPPIDGTVTMTVVDAGTARQADLDKVSLQGKLALVRESDDLSYNEQVAAVVAKGARAVLLYSAQPGVFWPAAGGRVPVLASPKADGEAIRAELRRRPVSVKFVGQPIADYAYDVAFVEQGQVPAQLAYKVTSNELATISTRMHTTGTKEKGWRLHNFIATPCGCSTSLVADLVPSTGYVRTEYVTTRPDVRVHPSWQYLYDNPGDEMYPRSTSSYQRGQRLTDDWLGAPFSPGPANSTLTLYGAKRASMRYADTIRYDIATWTDSAGHWSPTLASSEARSRLYRNGALVTSSDYGLSGTARVPTEDATYRLEADVDHDGSLFGLTTSSRSAWTFRSAGNGGTYALPLVDVDYTDVVDAATGRRALDLANTAGANRSVNLLLHAGHQLESDVPPVQAVKVWVSYDDGATWQETTTKRTAADTFAASYRHPRVKDGGYVSLKVRADDGAGNSLDQTLIRAYRLTR
ncbi:S8 family serine peptidase [Actinopolymorpha alba]|uniref:S8 family serine peptidase n=1 Tax=Actinopolymorpha alba TaxID=533267 RepID=UPI0003695C7E|nr:S8 family serine peptidase [Actinopolymorpha alba]